MKTKLTLTLAVFTLVAVGALNDSVTNRTNAQGARPDQGKAEDTPPVNESIFRRPAGAHCFCKVLANGQEVAKPTKGGFIQGIQKEGCKNYCRGLWDSGPAQRITWAKMLPITNTCGINLAVYAAIGTAPYELVRGPGLINLGTLVNNCTCPSGETASNVILGQKYCLISPSLANVPGVPDQINAGGYVWNNGNFYRSSGAAKCVKFCQ